VAVGGGADIYAGAARNRIAVDLKIKRPTRFVQTWRLNDPTTTSGGESG